MTLRGDGTNFFVSDLTGSLFNLDIGK